MNTLPGTTDMSTPIAKSMPVTQASQMPVLPNVPPYEQDIMKPISSEKAGSAYMERQIQGMSSVRLHLDTPSIEDESCGSTNLPKESMPFVKKGKRKGSMSRNLLQ